MAQVPSHYERHTATAVGRLELILKKLGGIQQEGKKWA